LRERLAAYCAASRVTESAVVCEALEKYLDRTGDLELILRRLDRQSRALDRLERDVDMNSQAFGLFVRLWFAHMPRIAQEARAAATASAEARYRRFLDRLAQLIARGGRFIDDLTQDRIADDKELDEIARAASPSVPGDTPSGSPTGSADS
jgi:hypothetical protein